MSKNRNKVWILLLVLLVISSIISSKALYLVRDVNEYHNDVVITRTPVFKSGYQFLKSKSSSDPYLKKEESTYFGGSNGDSGFSIALASDGSYYVTGSTASSDFPLVNAFDDHLDGFQASYVSKFAANGTLLWSTFLDGGSGDSGYGVATGADNSCYVVGTTRSNNYPTVNAFDSTFNGEYDAFITKLSSNGTILWSTYYGAEALDLGLRIAIGIDGCCYITGYTNSTDLPMLNAFDNTFNGGSCDAFIAKFSDDGSLLWSTYLGGDDWDSASDICIGPNNTILITGSTRSVDFPLLEAFDENLDSLWNAFVAKFASNGSLLWSTYLGGSEWAQGHCIAVGVDGSSYVSGYTKGDFPVLNAYDESFNGDIDIFVSKFDVNNTLQWSTYFGGSTSDYASDIDIAVDGIITLTGRTNSINFPILYGQERQYGWEDIFVLRFTLNGSPRSSTCFGGTNWDTGWGIATIDNNSCYVVGSTMSDDFPTMNAYDDTFNGTSDAIIAKVTEKEDVSAPIIQSIEIYPINPSPLDEVIIRCYVTDDFSGVNFVTLHYQANSGLWEQKNMTAITDFNYEYNLGTYNLNDTIYYFFTFEDFARNNATDDNNGEFYLIEIREIQSSSKVNLKMIIIIISMVFLPVLRLTIKRKK